MRILLVAPADSNIDSTSEVRTLSSMHKVHLLNGVVTQQDVYNAANTGRFDAIHFLTHGSPEVLAVSNGETLKAEDVVAITRQSEASIIFINACNSAKIGNAVIAKTDASVISTSIEIYDNEAWKLPMTFYTNVARRESANHITDYHKMLVEQFIEADIGDGTYGISINPRDYLVRIKNDTIMDTLEVLQESVDAVSRRASRYTMILTVISLILAILLFSHLLGVT